MDVLTLMEDHWESHKPVQGSRAPRMFKSFSALDAVQESSNSQMSSSQPLLQALMSSESSSNPNFIPRPPAAREASTESDSSQPTQSGSLTLFENGPRAEGAGTSSTSSQDGSQLELSESGSSSASRHRYDEGLGPAPPLVTAMLLLLMPVWLPVLTFFILPLVFMWAVIAGAWNPLPLAAHTLTPCFADPCAGAFASL